MREKRLLSYFIIVLLGILEPLLAISHNGTTCTLKVCKIDEPTLRFFLIGDWGGQDTPPYVTPAQKTVATTANKMGDERGVQFVLSVGDQFYTKGPKYVNDTRFRKTFDDVFTFGKADNVPWYVTAGNHDYYGDVQSQLDYSHVNPRWIYPDLSYVAHYELSPTSTTVDFIFVDTVILCGGTWYGGPDPKTGRFKAAYELPKGPENPDKAEALWHWVQKQLAQSRADYLFVVSHYPVFSSGAHGDFTCPGLRMLALLEKYNATAYLCGHDHNLQHLKSVSPTGYVVHHILSGGGNSLDKRTRKLKNGNVTVQFFFPKPEQHHLPNTDNVGGFVYAEIDRQNGSFWFYSGDGKVLYQVIMQPRWEIQSSNKIMQVYSQSGYSA